MSTFEEFCNATTLHGFRDYHTSKFGWKLFWVALIFTTFGITCYEVFKVCQGYVPC